MDIIFFIHLLLIEKWDGPHFYIMTQISAMYILYSQIDTQIHHLEKWHIIYRVFSTPGLI